MVMPRSRSRSVLSMTRSATCWLARNAPLCRSSPSTSVVLPWSTCATIATLRRSGLAICCVFRCGDILPVWHGSPRRLTERTDSHGETETRRRTEFHNHEGHEDHEGMRPFDWPPKAACRDVRLRASVPPCENRFLRSLRYLLASLTAQ